jgi:hypothetical protein
MAHLYRLPGSLWAALLALPLATLGCGEEPGGGEIGLEDGEPAAVELEQPFTSDVATLMDFAFSGELTSSSGTNSKGQIRAQLMYTVGQLNGQKSVARLDKAQLSGITVASLGNGLYRHRYTATLPVAWGSKTNLPTAYTFKLPRRVDQTGQSAFMTRYGSTCNDGYTSSVTLNNFWYHYRVEPAACSLAPADIVAMDARVTLNSTNTVAKYPEYHKIWEDGALNMVAIFGKYENGATSQRDAGIAAYNEFIQTFRRAYPQAVSVPADLPALEVGPTIKEVVFTFPHGSGVVNLNVFLIDSVTTVSAAWDKRYAELTPGADMILYNGHAGLGANIAALSRKGKFFPGKYQIFFMNGCDTFAYYDETLPNIRRALNPDDPTGTKYMDFITNAMPAYFHMLTEDSMALINAAVKHTQPTTYQNIFKNMDRVQVVVVTGEEDNVFTPTYNPGISWNGYETRGAVNKYETIRYETEVLQPGKYVFTTVPDPAVPGGDADLRVRVGTAPTITSTYKCPSYLYNSNERCVVTITTPSKVHMAVTGDKLGVRSPYILRAWQLKN